MATKQTGNTIHIDACEQDSVKLCILGTSPLIFNRMSEKARQQLLLGAGKKTAAKALDTAAEALKH